MAYILNPKYNPNDPNSQRYILQADGPMSSVTPNMSPAPVKTSVPSGPMSTVPAPTQSKQISTPAPAAPPAPPTLNANPYLTKLMPTVDTTTKTSTPSSTIPAAPPVAPSIPPPAPAPNPTPTYTPPSGPSDNYIPGLNETQKQSITNLVASGRPFSETDAKNYAYATGQGDYTQFIGKTGAQITGVGNQGGFANDGGTGAPNNPTAPNPNNPGGMSDQDLAIAAGKAGLSIDDYIAAVGKMTPQTAEQSQEIRNRLGIPGLVDKTYSQPSQTTVDAYNELYKMSGLDDVKAKIASIDDEINKKRQDLVTATGELQNNPWLSQASRTGRLRILTQLAEADINNSLETRKQYMDQYDNGVSKVEEAVTRKVNDQKLEREMNADKLNYLLNEAEKQDKLAAGKTTSQALRYLPDYLKAKGETGKQYPSGIIGEYQFYADQERKEGREPMGFNQYQTADANRKAVQAKLNAQGLDPATATRVDRIVGGFDNEPIVKNYNTIQEGYNFVNSVDNKTKNPADQQGLIYAFAKIMDPNSVVREGEYATVQKYAQSWATTYGFNAARIFSNSPFLTEAAIQNMKNTIQKKYDASALQYNNVVDEYGRRVDKLTGQTDGKDYLTNYAASAGGGAPTLKTYYQQNPAKQAQINQLINQGLADEDIMQIVGAGTFSQPPSTGKKGSLAVADNRRNPSKIINGYDFTNYATDPNWGNGVKRILSKIPPLTNAAQVGAYIAQVAPKSPLADHGDTIVRIAQQKGIAPQLLLAIMQQESNFGTLGRAAYTHNPANVGNVDSGANVDWGSWERGVQALADNVAKRTIA